MSVNPRADRPVYRQVADILRDQITNGTLTPGAMLPSEKQIADTHGVGRDAVRQAVALLRSEGLVRTTRGEGTYVRTAVVRRTVILEPGAQAIARMPTEQERIELRLDEGVPIVAIAAGTDGKKLYSGDEVVLISSVGPRTTGL